jgi:hypothetical protein
MDSISLRAVELKQKHGWTTENMYDRVADVCMFAAMMEKHTGIAPTEQQLLRWLG